LVLSLSASSAFAAHWEYNGSTFELESNGASRVFHYQNPRVGLPVEPGTVVFRGQRAGNTYVGTAYAFSKLCGTIGYPVTGVVTEDQRSVTLYGNVPVRSPTCKITTYNNNVLTFTFYDDAPATNEVANSDSTLICLQPVFSEEQRLKQLINGNHATTLWVAQAINYLRAKYCLQASGTPEHDSSTQVAETCFQYSGIYRGERVYWGGCFE
jgi:hypothetical protein